MFQTPPSVSLLDVRFKKLAQQRLMAQRAAHNLAPSTATVSRRAVSTARQVQARSQALAARRTQVRPASLPRLQSPAHQQQQQQVPLTQAYGQGFVPGAKGTTRVGAKASAQRGQHLGGAKRGRAGSKMVGRVPPATFGLGLPRRPRRDASKGSGLVVGQVQARAPPQGRGRGRGGRRQGRSVGRGQASAEDLDKELDKYMEERDRREETEAA